ncbi:transcription factor maf [Paramuricea clavata]|uniref:Neural retina-specific leucine zipper protein n=1 Tax=Paramuricea clavata TaxID=317549 RepID=A0A6S7H0G8_PARCT|nr:transcription factor maf [Paramuricea clavata]
MLEMELPQLQSEELSLLDLLEQTTMDGAASNGALSQGQGNIIKRDANLASTWHNTPLNMSRAYDQSELFSDTESFTSCGSAVASPAVFEFEHTEQNHFSYLQLNDNELKKLSVKELNTKLKGQPKEVVNVAKKRRRTLKNRGYAHSCRIKRIQEKSNLERSKEELKEIIASQRQQLEAVANERDVYKHRFETLITILGQNHNISNSG